VSTRMIFLGICLIIVTAAGCSPASQPTSPASISTETATTVPTDTPTTVPTATETSMPTDTPTTAPTATATPIPTDTSTPTPAIIYGQINVCFKSGEGVKSGVGLAVTLSDSEGKSPPGYTVDSTASKITAFTNRCKLLEKIPPGLYRVAGVGVLSQSALASGSMDDVEVFPDETTEIEILVEKVG